MFFLELLDQLKCCVWMCHDKTSIQILGSKSLSSGQAVNWQKTKLVVGSSQVHQASTSCVFFWFSENK